MRIIIDKRRIVLFGCFSVFSLIFCLLGIWRHSRYMTSIADLGCFDQAIWMASQGHALIITFHPMGIMNYLGNHFQPILYLFAPLYKLLPSVYWLILCQSAAISFSSLPIFLIARHLTGSDKMALTWSLIYLLNPFIFAAAAWDFQPAIIALFLISLALLAILKKRPIFLLLISIGLLACKEHMGLTVAGLGFLYGLTNKNWIVGAGLIAIGLSTMALVIGVIMPHYSLTGQHPMLNAAKDARYQWLGNSLSEVIKKLVSEPLTVIKVLFLEMEGGNYIFWLLAPFLFLPIGALFWMLPALGDFLANLLSANPMPRSLFSYHSATIVPLLTIAAIHGLRKLSLYLKTISAENILKTLLGFNLILTYSLAPLPLPGSVNFWRPIETIPSFDRRESIVKKMVENQSITVQANLGAHFTQRELIFVFPEKIGVAESIVLKLDNPTERVTPQEPSYIGTLAHHLHMPPAEYLDHIEKLLLKKDYQPIYWDDPWLILGKGKTPESPQTMQDIQIKLLKLRKEWILKSNQ
jgi:uncharacterized membrane protein